MASISLSKNITLGGSIIDFSRSQITTNGKTLSIEPKVMKVLHLLMEHCGEVVSQESIYQQVWGNGIFNASLIQRAIALLRRALADDAKSPVFIATFPKKGYSFIKPMQQIQRPVFTQYIGIAMTICLVIIIVTAVKWTTQSNIVEQPTRHFNQSTAVTSSAEQELFAKATINGELIGFIKQIDNNSQQIWAKNLQSHVEFPVSDRYENILSFDWSIDGNFISYLTLDSKKHHIYVASVSRTQQKPERANKTLTVADFSHVSELFWLDDKQIIFIGYHRINKHYQVLKLNSLTAKLTTVWQGKSAKGYTHASLNRDKMQLAFTTLTKNNNSQIHILDLQQLTLNTLEATLAPFIHLTWEFGGEHLLVSDPLRKNLQLVSLDGKTESLSIAHQDAGLYPQYLTPQKLLMTMQTKDADIGSWDYKLNEKEIIADSNNMDYFPMLSPNGENLVFVSNRDGDNKLYLNKDDTTILLPNSKPSNTKIDRPIWSANSKSIAYVLDNKLLVQTLDSKEINQINPAVSVVSLFDWIDESTLLVLIKEGDNSVLAALDITNNMITPIADFFGFNAHVDSAGDIWQISEHAISKFDVNIQQWLVVNALQNIRWSVKSNNALYLQLKKENQDVIVKINLNGTIIDEFNYPFEQFIILHSVDDSKFYFNSKFKTLSDVFLLSVSQ
ncbi:winged helix-turn-helix domain-containing protein [Colwelliaceae bacterium BS250]